MRYNNQDIFVNNRRLYRKYLKDRGINFISQYDTPKFKHPDPSDAMNFNVITHIWGTGDKYWKLASEYYSDAKLWWVVALYNQKPTEFHINPGDTIFIPVPLETVLYYMGY
tara:strand:+ start:46 stop:378 length:333 start_codon:yes stop_codon:yes gene_type:complete